MGIVTNGFLIGARKSSGGINFLKIRGQQVFRNKPQISKDYVPSAAQVLQRSLQSALTRGIRANDVLQELIASGWDRHVVKYTNANEFQREALRLFTREADGTLSPISEKESRIQAAETAGFAEYVIEQMASGKMSFTKSTWSFPDEAVSVASGVLSAVPAGVESAKQYLGNKYSQDYVNDEPFKAVVLESPGSITSNALPFTPATPGDVVLVAIAAPRVQNGEIVGYLYSNAKPLAFQ